MNGHFAARRAAGPRTAFFLAIAGVCVSASIGLADEVTDAAKAAVAKYVGIQSEWLGPTSAPKPQPGKQIVYLSGDENIDTSHEYGVYMQEAAAKIGWEVTVIDGKGSPCRGWRRSTRPSP